MNLSAKFGTAMVRQVAAALANCDCEGRQVCVKRRTALAVRHQELELRCQWLSDALPAQIPGLSDALPALSSGLAHQDLQQLRPWQ